MHRTVEHQSRRIEELVRELENSADPGVLSVARELVQSVMDLYGAGLERMTEIIATNGETGRAILDEIGRDELTGSLLAANGVHPLDLEARVRRAVEQLRPRTASQGTVELLSIDGGAIRVRLRPAAGGCGSHAGSFQSLVEAAVYEAAPDLTELAFEVVEAAGAAGGFVPLESLAGQPAANGKGAAL